MKAKELMIGDWVQIPEGKYQVCGIDDYDHCNIELEMQKKWHDEQLFVETYIEPIPLTPEILEANKAEVCYESCYQKKYHIWMEDDETCVEYKFSKQTEEYNNLTIYKGGGGCVNIHALCVHELQHALRLCGLTELADNFNIE